MTRGHSSQDSLGTLVLLPYLVGALLTTPTMLLAWQPVPLEHVALLVGIGVVGTAGFACMAWAYSNAHVNRLGLLDYTGLVWALVWGYCFFAELPSLWTLAGAALIMAACASTLNLAKTTD
ncbi:DMT family transporter [Curvibacter sp. CHRR-16]|uniref:DMT family transporter n=1 Tax=Curvibacter sp. CHRR-16 TaxID=2835872 RepID=UPI002023B4E8|nr:DMT family transporter [Curvibacter sp. CHRR-16]